MLSPTIQSSARSVPSSTRPAITSSDVPGRAVRPSRTIACPTVESSFASAQMKMCSQRAAAYASPKISASSSKACGTARAAISIAPIAANMSTRSTPSSAAM